MPIGENVNVLRKYSPNTWGIHWCLCLPLLLVLQGCHSKVSQAGCLRRTEINFLKARIPRSRCQQSWLLLRTLRENWFHAFLLDFVRAGNLWCSLSYRCIATISASVSNWCSLFLHTNSSTWWGKTHTYGLLNSWLNIKRSLVLPRNPTTFS